MTHVEQAIKEAAERGGWMQEYPDHRGIAFVSGGIMRGFFGQEGEIGADFVSYAEIFLNPSFWTAYGKARGWKEHKKEGCLCVHVGEYCYMSYWELFIHHLAEGKDAESFFATLV